MVEWLTPAEFAEVSRRTIMRALSAVRIERGECEAPRFVGFRALGVQYSLYCTALATAGFDGPGDATSGANGHGLRRGSGERLAP
jgi:hypothetical protein